MLLITRDYVFDSIVGAVPYQFTDKVREDNPKFLNDIPVSFDLRTNVLDKLNGKLFFKDIPLDCSPDRTKTHEEMELACVIQSNEVSDVISQIN